MRATTLKLRVDDSELARIDANRGLATRSAYLRSLIPGFEAAETSFLQASHALAVEKGLAVDETHAHSWKRDGQYLDSCGCGAERPHQAGTK